MRVLTIPVLMSLIGCGLLDSDEIDIQIQTDQSNYQIDSTETIGVDVTNNSDNTIYYICTGQIYLEEISNGQTTNSWMVHGFEECYSPGPIEVDETRSFEIDLYWIWSNGFLDDLTLSSEVMYRLRFDLYEDSDFENMISGSEVLSNNFTFEFI